jgi:hypothetical protein
LTTDDEARYDNSVIRIYLALVRYQPHGSSLDDALSASLYSIGGFIDPTVAEKPLLTCSSGSRARAKAKLAEEVLRMNRRAGRTAS